MELFQDYFLCDKCKNRDFRLIYNFSLRFHKVNFSEELIYDRVVDELYQCTECGRTFTNEEIQDGLSQFKRARKRQR